MEGSKIVFIGNLSWTTNNDSLFEFLNQAGGVLSAQVQRHEDTNRSKGWGLAEFVSTEAAAHAVALLDRKDFDGRLVHMRLDRSHLDSVDGAISVYVGNLAWSVTDQELLQLFSGFNPLNCHVLTNMYGRSRGFAILKFRNEIEAGAAIDRLNHSEVAGRKIECRFDRGPVKPDETVGRTAIFVAKLSPAIVTDADLASLFRHIGPVAEATLQRATNGKSKGWGIVKFHTYADAKKAVDSMNGRKFSPSAFPLEVRFDRK